MTWRSLPEAGTLWGIRAVAATYRVVGRRGAGALLWCVAWYFVFFGGVQRRAALDYFRRVGHPATLGEVHALIWRFARVALDRLLFLLGDIEELTVELHGHEELMRVAQSKRGALLLGSHLGSFEAMRSLARSYDVPLLVVADFSNARKVNSLLQELSGNLRIRLLELNADEPLGLLEVKAAIERGELVAMLGDRRTDRVGRDVAVPFLGGIAQFPVGPYVIAHVLECPVYFVAALYETPSRYDLHFVPLAERIVLPRQGRKAALEHEAARYARMLEDFTVRSPLNWFNFYSFWVGPSD
jgi:predicted LPLAT superfamily acyltransferase